MAGKKTIEYTVEEKTIELTTEEKLALGKFIAHDSEQMNVIKKVIMFHLEILENIMLIDPKSNVGLQTCSRQNAFITLGKIFNDLFHMKLPIEEKKEERTKNKNQWQ